ncbi:MAG: potassium transporter TrkG, partial [Planctomycetota bacterium]
MNIRLLFRLLGILSLLIGFFMLASLIWTNPNWSFPTDSSIKVNRFEREGFWGLINSTLICVAVGTIFLMIGRGADGKLFRKEAMAVVGLSWLLATLLGALPFVLSGTYRGPSIRVFEQEQRVFVIAPGTDVWKTWTETEVNSEEFNILIELVNASAVGLTRSELTNATPSGQAVNVFDHIAKREPFRGWLIGPGEGRGLAPADRASNYRLRWVKMNFVDAMFESQSGFSTTGATVLSNLEDPNLVPRCILFWRSSTHFLGGLGIIVLFV